MAGEDNILNLFIRANIEGLKPQMDAAVNAVTGGISAMKTAAGSLPASIESSVSAASAAFVSLNPTLIDQAARVLDLKVAYDAAREAIRDTEEIVKSEGGTEEVSASIKKKYAEETVNVLVQQKALSEATKEYDATLRNLLNAQILAAEAERTKANATEQSTAAASKSVITDEARARVKAEIARLDTLEAERATARAAATVAATASENAATAASIPVASGATAAYERLAAATLSNARAQADLRSITATAVEAIGMESAMTTELALAQQRCATTALELAAAEKVIADATAGASEGQNLFRARVIASEFGMRAFISSTITSVPVLIGVLAAGFAVRAVEAIQKTELELANLSTMTGITIRDLYDIGKAAEAFGARSEDLTGALRRLDKVVSDAASGSETARLTLKELGVDMTALNAGIVPKTSTVLAQMADYLHVNSGNAEVMRAAMRALGTDSVALGAFLAQGSQKVQEQSQKFALTGTAMQQAAADARKLSEVQAELGATWDRIKLPLLELTNGVIVYGLKTLEAIGFTLTWPFEAVVQGFNDIRGAIFGVTQADADFMAQTAKALNRRGSEPPQFAMKKDEKPKAAHEEKSDLPEFREELAQREAAFEGSRSEMLAMELAFWEQLISTGRVKARDLIAVHKEVATTEIALRREVIREAESEARDNIALTKSGSDARVEETRKAMELERRLHKEGSVEFQNAEKEYLLAVRDRVEESIRLNLQATDEQIASTKTGSAARTALYGDELLTLQDTLREARAAVTTAQAEETATGTNQSHQRMLIAQGEVDFILAEIAKVTKEYNKAQLEQTTTAQRQAAERARLAATEAIGSARENIGLADAEASKQIQAVEQNGLLTLREKDALIRQIIEVQKTKIGNELADAEAVAASAVANAQLNGTIEQQIAAIRLLDQVHKLQAAESKRIYEEELSEDNRLAKQMEQNALRVGSVISSSFTRAFDTMLTTHTNFKQVMIKFWNDMVLGFARMGVEILANWIKMIAAKTVAWIVGEHAQTAATATGTAARSGIGFLGMLKSIAHAAAKAAAWAFSGTMEALGGGPWAIPVAAAAAAGAFTVVLGMAALASAAGGADLQQDTVLQAHKGELVLPAGISAGLKSIISGGSAAQGSSNSGSGGGIGGTKIMHVRPNITVNSYGGQGSDDIMEQVTTAVRKAVRAGALGMA